MHSALNSRAGLALLIFRAASAALPRETVHAPGFSSKGFSSAHGHVYDAGTYDMPSSESLLIQIGRSHGKLSASASLVEKATSCAAEGSDPFSRGYEVPCCDGLQTCIGDWLGKGIQTYLCKRFCDAHQAELRGEDLSQGAVMLQVSSSSAHNDLQVHSHGLQEFTVLCWNVLWKNFNVGGGHAGKREELANVMMNTMHADVAGLQECMSEDEMAHGLAGRMLKAPGTDTFNCIFYKPGVVEFLGISGRRYLGDYARDDYSERYVSYAKLRFAGVDFWLFSSHWCINGPCRGYQGGLRHRHSARVITELRDELGAGGMPAIITADTNSHMDGLNSDDGIVWLLDHGFEIAHQGTWPFDVMFVSSGDWRVGARVDGPSYPSDHPSLSVRLAPVAQVATSETSTLEAGAEAQALTPEASPLPQPTCASFHQWPDVDNHVTCGNCTALVSTRPYNGRCDRYCESFGHTCLGAAEEVRENCAVKSTYQCHEEIRGTSDMLCQCGQEPPPSDVPAGDTGYTDGDNGTSWEYFEGYVCYPGHGAEDIAGKSPVGNMTTMFDLQGCRAACEEEPTCEGIVMLRSLPEYLCWLRKGVELSRCTTNSHYDFWLRSRSGN